MKTMPYLFLALSLFLVTCSKDSPTGPSTTIPTTTATAIIGPSGGKLICEGFSMTVPASAFASAETLTVKKETYDGSFGSNDVTNQFRLEGFPSEFTGTIEIRLKSTRTPEQGLFLGMGSEGVNSETGESRILYDLYPATLDSGYVKISLAPPGLGRRLGKGVQTPGGNMSSVSYLIGYDKTISFESRDQHFWVFCALNNEQMGRAIADELENAHAWSVLQAGFNQAAYNTTRWPVIVQILWSRNFSANELVSIYHWWSGQFTIPIPQIRMWCNDNEWDHGIQEFRKWLFAHYSNIFCVAQDGFFHDPFYPMARAAHANRVWPYTAIGDWAGAEAHVPGYDSLPPEFAGRKLTPLNGIPCPSSKNADDHGAGMTGLMKYFGDVYGQQKLQEIYRALPTATNAIDLLFNKIPDPEYVWYPEFMKRYLLGEIYSVPADTFLVDLQGGPGSREFTISGKNDTLKYFSADYRDLSTKLYRVNLRYPDISTSATITFEIGSKVNLSYAHILVFGLKNHKLEYWAKSSKVTVTNLKDLTAGGYDIVAALVNSANESPYDKTMSIDLDVKVNQQAQTFSLACIKVWTAGTITYYDGTTSSTTASAYNSAGHFHSGTFTNAHFAAAWNQAFDVTNQGTWDIDVDLNSVPPKITFFRVSETETSSSSVETWRIEASSTCAIPGKVTMPGRYVFRVEGTDVSKHMKPAYNRLAETSGVYWRELTGTSYDQNSYIEIVLE